MTIDHKHKIVAVLPTLVLQNAYFRQDVIMAILDSHLTDQSAGPSLLGR